MAYVNVIEGKYVDLKSATIDDAEFTLNIRNDLQFIKYIPKINNTLSQQEEWINKQRERAGDYFFVVWDKNCNPIGTIGVYGINSGTPESGRLALKGNAVENFEAAYLLYDFSFYTLGIECLTGYIYADNKRAIRYNKQFGVIFQEPTLDESNRLVRRVTISAQNFKEKSIELKKLIYQNQ